MHLLTPHFSKVIILRLMFIHCGVIMVPVTKGIIYL